MNRVTYEERLAIYQSAKASFGHTTQLTVAVEEFAELQKEICKILRGQGDLSHLSEEIADATIMLEQLREMFGVNEQVCLFMDEKVIRLKHRIEVSRLHR